MKLEMIVIKKNVDLARVWVFGSVSWLYKISSVIRGYDSN